MKTKQTVSFLKISLHHKTIGYLAGYQNGYNTFTFDQSYLMDSKRPTLSLYLNQLLARKEIPVNHSWHNNHHLHPIFSNLLPEGTLREHLAQELKIHPNNEFKLLGYLGHDLPGAIAAAPINENEIPQFLLNNIPIKTIATFDTTPSLSKFSLAGVQMKFSMLKKQDRFTLANQKQLGDWIIKTPSFKHTAVPQNEFSAMTLAQLANVTIPEIALINISQLEGLSQFNIANEPYAYAIKRFDRNQNECIHMEDFAQVLNVYPYQKYDGGNYNNIGKILHQYSPKIIDQFIRRLIVNILLANGDAHLKNWSLIYPDQYSPTLSPAYDILSTHVYFPEEDKLALKLGKIKLWRQTSMEDFKIFAKKADIPWKIVEQTLVNTLERAKSLWPEALKDLPMIDQHKDTLRQHWQQLHPDFQILS